MRRSLGASGLALVCAAWASHDLGRDRLLGASRHQLPELQLELVHQHRRTLGGGAEPVVLQFGDGELQGLDLGVEIVGAFALCDQHRLQCGDIVGKRGGIEDHRARG